MEQLIDCDRVADDQLADRYVMGQLSHDEAETFEDHYMTCATCVVELEQAEIRVQGFKRVGAEAAEQASISPVVLEGAPAAANDSTSPSLLNTGSGSGAWGRIARSPAPWMALAALLAVAVALPYLTPQNTGGELGTNGQVAVFHLQPERSADLQTGHRVQIPAEHSSIVLALELDPPFYDSYRATLTREGDQIWRGTGLALGERDTLNLSLDSHLLRPGDHQLFLEGTLQEQWVEVTRFAFRAFSGE